MEFGIKTDTYVKRKESSEINPHIYGIYIYTHTHTHTHTHTPYDKAAKSEQWEKNSLFNIWC